MYYMKLILEIIFQITFLKNKFVSFVSLVIFCLVQVNAYVNYKLPDHMSNIQEDLWTR